MSDAFHTNLAAYAAVTGAIRRTYGIPSGPRDTLSFTSWDELQRTMRKDCQPFTIVVTGLKEVSAQFLRGEITDDVTLALDVVVRSVPPERAALSGNQAHIMQVLIKVTPFRNSINYYGYVLGKAFIRLCILLIKLAVVVLTIIGILSLLRSPFAAYYKQLMDSVTTALPFLRKLESGS